MLDLLLLGIYIPSGLSKIVAPSNMAEMWPRLPSWFWPVAGFWEVIAALLTRVEGWEGLAYCMLYMFMGGVFCSVVYIPDQNGHTHVGGKGALGAGGAGMLVPSTLSTAFLVKLQMDNGIYQSMESWPLIPVVCMAAGFILGMALTNPIQKKKD